MIVRYHFIQASVCGQTARLSVASRILLYFLSSMGRQKDLPMQIDAATPPSFTIHRLGNQSGPPQIPDVLVTSQWTDGDDGRHPASKMDQCLAWNSNEGYYMGQMLPLFHALM